MATSRRGHGEGSVFYDERRKRWIALLDLGRDGTGKRQRVARSAKSKPDATAILRVLQGTNDRGDDPRGARRTIRQALDDYEAHGIDTTRAPSTQYKTLLYAGSFADAMGSRPLREVNVRHVEQWLGKLAAEKKTRRTLVEARSAAARVIDHAIRLGWAPPERNPVRLARIPESAGTIVRPVLDDDAVTNLLLTGMSEWWGTLLAFIAVTGVRVGEAAALAWSDVDAEKGLVVIHRAVRVEPDGSLSLVRPKSNSSRRISLPPEMAELMRTHRTHVAERCLSLGRPTPDLAFPTTTGTLADPNGLRRWLRIVAKTAAVDIKGFHDLRHAVASTLADQGAAPIHVAALLGHATPRTTLGVYTHPVAPSAAVGVDRGARLLSK
jgi:integrase